MKAGVHLPNDGRMSGDDLALVQGLQLVKGLVRLDADWDELDWGRLAPHLRPDCTVILRLYYPGRLDPWEFVSRSARKLPGVLEALGEREVLIEIHNEPNHAEGIEGWGRTEAEAEDFAWWFAEVREGLSVRGFGGLGWPGLALGEWAHGERTWAQANRANIGTSDWIGVHCYWQRPEELDHPQLGGNWRWYRQRWPRRRVFVTECGNSSCHNPELPQVGPDRQRAEYLEWCQLGADGGVAGVAFYVLGGSEDWAGFRLYPETVRALARESALAGARASATN